jgi:eukaryotic-like serine/threonine-protein kinase
MATGCEGKSRTERGARNRVNEMVFGRRYRVTEKIGTGGMAEVYKAVDEVLGRTVAVKVMHPQYAADASYAARFRQEAQAAANISSPNIVNMYDWGQDGDTYYIVMEYVRGRDLKDIILENGPLDSRKVADIGAQVASALSAAHGYDVIHRDVKPQNIMVQPDGSVKVMDFGIARAGGTTMTQTGSVLGTAHYVSPEQAQGTALTPASDLYSLGVVLYEAATGRPPFDADTPVAVALKQVNDTPAPPHVVNPSVSADLEAIILKAMAKRPADRYATAAEMRSDLLAVAEGRKPGIAAAAGGVAAAAAAAAGAGAGAAAARYADQTAVIPQVATPSQQATAQTAPRRSAQTKKRRPPVWPWILLAVVLLAGLGYGAYALGLFRVTVSVPDLTNQTVPQATTQLEALGLTIGTVKAEFSDQVDAGKIISQDPGDGVRLEKGGAVNLVVSKGVEMVPVPSVVNQPEGKAFQILRDAELQPVPGPQEYSAKVPEGNVIKQDPRAGESVPKGSQVTYIVSRGVKMIQVPDVVGKTSSQARAILTKAQLKYSVAEEFSDTVAKGVVISQNPSGGMVPIGSTVTITVSKGPDTVKVPKVIDMTEAQASTTLTSAGLQVKVTTVPMGSTTPPGTVVDQDPAPNTTVKRGSTVEIFVAQAGP